MSHGKSVDGPVAARDDVVDVVDPVVPVFPVFPAVNDAVDVAPAAAAPVTVVEVVVLEGDVVVVVVEVVEVVAAAVKVTVTGMAVRSMLSDVSSAVYFTDSAVKSLTAKVAVPLLFVVALVAATFDAPPDSVSVTVFPDTGSPLPS